LTGRRYRERSIISNLASLAPERDPLLDLLEELLALKQRILTGTGKQLAEVSADDTDRDCLSSLENLLNYIVMRREDLRPLQVRLSNSGLSSLGRREPHVLKNIDRVIDVLSRAVPQRAGYIMVTMPTLSAADMQALQFVSQHADMVGLSFAESPEDVLYLQEQLKRHGADDVPVIARIETARAVKNLPGMRGGAYPGHLGNPGI